MDVSLGEHWDEFVAAAVRSGRYASASEVLREGLRLIEERELKLASLRETLDAAIAEGGCLSAEEVAAALDAHAAARAAAE